MFIWREKTTVSPGITYTVSALFAISLTVSIKVWNTKIGAFQRIDIVQDYKLQNSPTKPSFSVNQSLLEHVTIRDRTISGSMFFG